MEQIRLVYPSPSQHDDAPALTEMGLSRLDSAPLSAQEVDEYLGAVEEPKRGTLQALRSTILEIVPDAQQVISYRVPAFRVHGHTVAGFAAFKRSDKTANMVIDIKPIADIRAGAVNR